MRSKPHFKLLLDGSLRVVSRPSTPNHRKTAMQTIAATLTRCRHGQALVVLESRPFNGVELRPGDLRQLAQQLNAIADMAARLPTGGKHWRATRVELGAEPTAQPRADA